MTVCRTFYRHIGLCGKKESGVDPVADMRLIFRWSYTNGSTVRRIEIALVYAAQLTVVGLLDDNVLFQSLTIDPRRRTILADTAKVYPSRTVSTIFLLQHFAQVAGHDVTLDE